MGTRELLKTMTLGFPNGADPLPFETHFLDIPNKEEVEDDNGGSEDLIGMTAFRSMYNAVGDAEKENRDLRQIEEVKRCECFFEAERREQMELAARSGLLPCRSARGEDGEAGVRPSRRLPAAGNLRWRPSRVPAAGKEPSPPSDQGWTNN